MLNSKIVNDAQYLDNTEQQLEGGQMIKLIDDFSCNCNLSITARTISNMNKNNKDIKYQ